MLKVLLVNEQEIIRIGLRDLLIRQLKIVSIAECAKLEDTISTVKVIEPDVAVLGIDVNRSADIEMVRRLCATVGKVKVIVLAHGPVENAFRVVRLFQAGIRGYILEDSPASEFLNAVNEVSKGSKYLDSCLQDMLIDEKNPNEQASRGHQLTTREREVLHLIAEGYTNSRISEELGISLRTVELHRGHINRKLGLSRPRIDNLQYAQEREFIETLDESMGLD